MNRSMLGSVLLACSSLACSKEVPSFMPPPGSTGGDDTTTGITFGPVTITDGDPTTGDDADPTTGAVDIDGTSASGDATTAEDPGASSSSTAGEPGSSSSGEPGSSGPTSTPTCGDDVVDPNEDCDGREVSGATCGGLGFGGGMLACADDCTWDTTGCTDCGNGSLDAGEACDGVNLAGLDCTDFGYVGGALGCDADCIHDVSACSSAGSPFFSEYVEGSANNKALEIYNPTAAAFDLGACEVQIYFNGSAASGTTIPLAGNLPPAATWVICDDDIVDLTACDVLSGASFHNGDDAIALVCSGSTIDVIGQIGFDPGSEWQVGGVGTGEATLRRSCTVSTGDANGANAFDPSLEWAAFAQNSLGDLGQYTCP